MYRTIRVTGKGRLSIKPDVTRLNLSLEGMEKEYDAALKLSSNSTEALKATLEQFGFERKDLKTLHFNIEAVYESYQAKDRSWKQRFEGYRYSHHLKVEFHSDNVRLGKILYALGHCEVSPEIRIEYTISDPENAKNELLAKAVADSKAKAVILADAAGVTLGEITTIDYSWADLEFVSRPMNKMMLCEDAAAPTGSYDLDIEADDIDVEDTVTVIWKIS